MNRKLKQAYLFRIFLYPIVWLLAAPLAQAQSGDSLAGKIQSILDSSGQNSGTRISDSSLLPAHPRGHAPALVQAPFPYKAMIIPGALVAYGVSALSIKGLKNLNSDIREDVWTEEPHKRLGIDNFLQFSPILTVYSLNALGVRGRHNFKDLTSLYIISNIIAEGSVLGLKAITHQLRPDGSAYNSFPSGHTTEAFISAEIMRLEYKDVSPWYGVAGYAMATATGALRIYNNRHWLSDVVAGAGIGMASTRIAYWLYPRLQQVFGKSRSAKTVLMPTYGNGAAGLALVRVF